MGVVGAGLPVLPWAALAAAVRPSFSSTPPLPPSTPRPLAGCESLPLARSLAKPRQQRQAERLPSPCSPRGPWNAPVRQPESRSVNQPGLICGDHPAPSGLPTTCQAPVPCRLQEDLGIAVRAVLISTVLGGSTCGRLPHDHALAAVALAEERVLLGAPGNSSTWS